MASLAESRTQQGVPLTLRLPAESVSSAVVLLHEYAERSPIPASESLIKLWKEEGSQFSPTDCVHALETCVIATRLRADHFGEARSEMIPALIEKLGQGIPTLSRSDLVSASIAVEVLRITAPSVQKQIADTATARISEFIGEGREKGLVTIAWGLAKQRCPHEAFFTAAEELIEKDRGAFKIKWIQNIGIAARAVEHPTTRLEQIHHEERLLRKDPDLNSGNNQQHSASTRGDLRDSHSRRYNFSTMSVDEIGAVFRGDVKLPIDARIALHRSVHHRVDQFSPKQLSALLETFCNTPGSSPATLDKVCAVLTEKLTPTNGATPVLLSALSSVWVTGRRQERLLMVIADKLTMRDAEDGALRFTRLDSDALALISKTYADQNVYNKELFEALSDEFVLRAGKISPQAQKDWIYGLTRMNQIDEPVLGMLHHILTSARGDAGVRTSGLFAQAAALSDSPIASAIWQSCISAVEGTGADLPEPVVFQLLQTGIALQQEIPEWLRDTVAILNAPLNLAHRTAFVESRQSPFETDVRNELVALGLNPVSQVPLHGYFIDLVVESGGKRYAIECDGSLFHQRSGRHSNVLLGNSEIKSRVLQNEGFELIRIADEEWRSLSDKGRTLSKLLALPLKKPDAA